LVCWGCFAEINEELPSDATLVLYWRTARSAAETSGGSHSWNWTGKVKLLGHRRDVPGDPAAGGLVRSLCDPGEIARWC
jgi:hypothetical protein